MKLRCKFNCKRLNRIKEWERETEVGDQTENSIQEWDGRKYKDKVW